jgi:uncharacterized membrane protein YccC
MMFRRVPDKNGSKGGVRRPAIRAVLPSRPRVQSFERVTRLFARVRPAALRQAVRMTVATVVAYLGTRWLGLPEGYWAVITCLIVVQGSLGATLSAGISRAYGTIAGGLLGGAGAWVHARFGLPAVWILGIVVLPLSLLAALNTRYRLAPVTAALVTLATPSGFGSFAIALHRIEEILLGGVIGAATALFVLPDRGSAGIRVNGAAALTTLGEIVRRHLTNTGGTDELTDHLQKQLAGVEAADADAAQERQFRLSGEPASRPLLRTLRRLRTDVAMIGRTVQEQPGTEEEHTAFADPVTAWFNAASRALAGSTAAPDLAAVDRAGATLRPGTPLQLVHTVLRRDLGDMADRITERSRA